MFDLIVCLDGATRDRVLQAAMVKMAQFAPPPHPSFCMLPFALHGEMGGANEELPT